MSATLLLYTAVIVPVQICLWNYDDPCNKFPTLEFDVFVDCFFVVLQPKTQVKFANYLNETSLII